MTQLQVNLWGQSESLSCLGLCPAGEFQCSHGKQLCDRWKEQPHKIIVFLYLFCFHGNHFLVHLATGHPKSELDDWFYNHIIRPYVLDTKVKSGAKLSTNQNQLTYQRPWSTRSSVPTSSTALTAFWGRLSGPDSPWHLHCQSTEQQPRGGWCLLWW